MARSPSAGKEKKKASIPALRAAYREKRGRIASRLTDFERIGKEGSEEDIFLELVFCILTPQSRARAADDAIGRMREAGRALFGSAEEIRSCLYGVRFPNNKSRFVFLAREVFAVPGGGVSVRGKIPLNDPKAARSWLVKNVKGLGMKEASHFLRNIGYGRDLAILDVHILRRLRGHGVTGKLEQGLAGRKYLETEARMRAFSRKAGIPLAHLDLLFWSDGTGEIFK